VRQKKAYNKKSEEETEQRLLALEERMRGSEENLRNKLQISSIV
jgi:hypothetical protein